MICSQCAMDKPLDAFHPDRRHNTGYGLLCEACYQANLPTSLLCTGCGLDKSLEDFPRFRHTHHGRQQPCNTCRYSKARQQRLAHPKSRAARWLKTAWICRDCGVEKPLDAFRVSRKSRMGHIQPCKDCCKKTQNAWGAAHPDKVWARNHRRLSRRNNVPFAFTKKDHTFMMQYWGYCCAVCGREEGLFNQSLCMDHWIPLTDSACPGTIPTNIIPLCSRMDGCNSSKGHTQPLVWLRRRYGKAKAARILRKVETYFEVVRQRLTQETSAAD